jgi:hypothetical protein
MRLMAGVAIGGAGCVVALVAIACRPPTDLQENWTCDFDAMENRPLDDPGATANDAGELPASDCMGTCGPPVTTCTFVLLEASVPGARCPVCTF